MATVLLRHADAGAPALTGEDGSLYNVLKWAAPQLGWTVAFDNESDYQVALRNDPVEGTGAYFQVKDKAADHDQDARMARVQGYLSMEGIDDGAGAWMDATERYWMKSRHETSNAVDWIIVGDALSMYFMTRFDQAGSSGNSPLYAILFAGDFISYKPADAGAFLIVTSSPSSLSQVARVGISHVAYSSFSTGEAGTHLVDAAALDYTGASSGERLDLIGRGGALSTGSRSLGTIGPSLPDPVSSAVNAAVVELWEGGAGSRRGRLPGLLNPAHNVSGWTQVETVSDVGTPSSNPQALAINYTGIGNATSITGAVGWALFDLGDWR